MTSHWSSKYIGMKFDRKSMNCAHLVELIYRNELDQKITLPKIEDYSPDGLNFSLSFHFSNYCVPTDSGPKEYDIALMKSWKHYNHVGVCCFVNNKMCVVHSFLGARQVVVTDLNRLGNLALELEGVYQCL